MQRPNRQISEHLLPSHPNVQIVHAFSHLIPNGKSSLSFPDRKLQNEKKNERGNLNFKIIHNKYCRCQLLLTYTLITHTINISTKGTKMKSHCQI